MTKIYQTNQFVLRRVNYAKGTSFSQYGDVFLSLNLRMRVVLFVLLISFYLVQKLTSIYDLFRRILDLSFSSEFIFFAYKYVQEKYKSSVKFCYNEISHLKDIEAFQ